MLWIAAALAAALLWSVVSVIDKVAVGRYVANPSVYLCFIGLAAGIPVIGITVRTDMPHLPAFSLLLCVITGVLYICYTYFFLRAMQLSDAPVVTNLLLLVPVFSTVAGYVFFHERLGPTRYLGITAVVLGSAVVSLGQAEPSEGSKRIGISKSTRTAVLLMTASGVLTTLDYALQKYLLTKMTALTLFYWGRVGDLLTAGLMLAIAASLRNDLLRVLRQLRGVLVGMAIGNELLSLCATYLLIVAYSLGPLSLVTTAASVQPLFVLALVLGVNAVRQGAVPSLADRKLVWLRLPGTALTVLGVYLIAPQL